MTRVGALFDHVCSFENLWRAASRAQAGKRYRAPVLAFNIRLEDHLHALRRELLEGGYRPGGHRHFQIHEPKRRWISAASYRDRVVHHAVCNVIEPLIDRRLIYDTWANRVGKGTHRAVLRYQYFAGRSRFALKMDVRKYFPSIDHAILKAQVRRLFKDPRLIELLDLIVDLGENPEEVEAYFPGDDLFTPLERRRGLPIGNLTSQILANLYLDGFDHWAKEFLRASGYVRFMDDFILLHDSKAVLLDWKRAVSDRLETLRLQVHARKSVIRRVEEGLPFLGYVVWPGRIRVRGATVRRFRRRFRRKQKLARDVAGVNLRQSHAAWRGHVGLAGTFRTLGDLA